jgi:ribosomal protein S18 acetylase RimI-like enzyme
VTEIRVEPLRATHRPHVERIVRAAGVFNEGEIGVALELFDSFAENSGTGAADVEKRTSDYEFVGAFDAERLVGYACFGATPSTDRTYDLYWIAVHPDAQHAGAGSALMRAVERQLVSRPARLMIVETSSRDDYAPTRRFYNKRGYEEAARLRDFYAPGDDRVVLSKRMGAVVEHSSFPHDAYE